MLNNCFLLSKIFQKTLSEPIELIVMLTMLLAQMYDWSVAKDFNQKWKSVSFLLRLEIVHKFGMIF